MLNFIRAFVRNEEGATAIEYGLMAALIAVAIIAMVGFIGDELLTTFTTIRDQLVDANST
jgi:pilus assembly protein Flp/PilA